MANETEVIQRQMDETRTSLQDKLETLENQVTSTVQGATDAVGETVDSVKDAVHETVETVKGTVQDTVQSVKDSLDVAQHVRTHPWPMFFGAIAVGFVAARVLSRAVADAPSRRSLPSRQQFAGVSPEPHMEAASAPGPLSSVAQHYRGELTKVKELALGGLGGVVRDMLISMAPPAFGDSIKEVANDITQKMGGRVFEEPILPPPPQSQASPAGTPPSDCSVNAYAERL